MDMNWGINWIAWHWRKSLLIALMFSGLLLFIAPTTAAAMPSTGGNSGLGYSPLSAIDWVTLASGAQHWYAFHNEGASTALDGGAITVRMTVLPDQGATFAILTPEQVRQWLRGDPLTPVGDGTRDALFPNESSWTGSFVQSGTYCILIKSTGHGLSNYKLTISGQGLAFPSADAGPVSGPNDCLRDFHSPLTTPAPTPTAVTPSNSSPEQPLLPVGRTVTIARGERQWYTFRDEGDDASIQVIADATPDHCLTFQIWTSDQLQRWQHNESFIPVGQGTPNAFLKADLFWTGSFVKSGLYYVVVERDHSAQGDCAYKLWVTGHDVSLPLPASKQ